MAGNAVAQESPFTDPFSSQIYENDLSQSIEVSCANLPETLQLQRELNELYHSLMQVSLNRTKTILFQKQITPKQAEDAINDIDNTLDQMDKTEATLEQRADKIQEAISSCLPIQNKE